VGVSSEKTGYQAMDEAQQSPLLAIEEALAYLEE